MDFTKLGNARVGKYFYVGFFIVLLSLLGVLVGQKTYDPLVSAISAVSLLGGLKLAGYSLQTEEIATLPRYKGHAHVYFFIAFVVVIGALLVVQVSLDYGDTVDYWWTAGVFSIIWIVLYFERKK